MGYRTTRHVNIQEMSAAKLVLRDACARNCDPERLVNGTDSRVTLGALGKGRSSSAKINSVLRPCLGYRYDFGTRIFGAILDS